MERRLEDRFDATLDVLGELDEIRPVLETDQALHHDIDGVPAEGGEGAAGVDRHDRLDARGDLGRLLPVEGEVQAHAEFREGRMELQERVGIPIVAAGTLHHALEAPAVLRIDEDDDVAAPDGLGEEAAQRHALAGLCRSHQQRAALEVLQRPVQRLLPGLDAMDEGQADLGVGLRVDGVAQQTQNGWRCGVVLVVDLCEFVEALRVHRQPLEAEAQEDLRRITRQGFQPACRDDLHGLAGQRRPDGQHVEALSQSVAGHQQRKEG